MHDAIGPQEGGSVPNDARGDTAGHGRLAEATARPELVLDDLSGTKLLDEKSSAQPGFRSVTVSAVDRYVELRLLRRGRDRGCRMVSTAKRRDADHEAPTHVPVLHG